MNLRRIVYNQWHKTNQKVLSATLDVADQYYYDKNAVETLFLHGFWRSGTTYLQELLSYVFHARTIVEPWNEACPATKALMDDMGLDTDVYYRKLYMPRYDDAAFGQWKKTLKTGRLTGAWVHSASTWNMLRPDHRNKIITKFVRGAFFLPAMAEREDLKWIFLKRDVFTTLDSFKRTKWTYWFETIDLEKLLLDESHALVFSDYQAFIERWNQAESIGKIAAYKLLTDYYAEQHAASSNGLLVTYETLIADPESVVGGIADHIGWEIKSSDWIEKTQKPSKFTSHTSIDAQGNFVLPAQALTVDEVLLIRQVLEDFDATQRSVG